MRLSLGWWLPGGGPSDFPQRPSLWPASALPAPLVLAGAGAVAEEGGTLSCQGAGWPGWQLGLQGARGSVVWDGAVPCSRMPAQPVKRGTQEPRGRAQVLPPGLKGRSVK